MGNSFIYPFLRDYLPSTFFHDIWIRYLITGQDQFKSKKLNTRVLDLDFKSPVGLESGIDINCVNLHKLLSIGLGYVELGPITPACERSVFLRKVVTPTGIVYKAAEENLGAMFMKRQLITYDDGPRGVNLRPLNDNVIGIPHLTDEDYLYSFQELYPYSDYFTINLAPTEYYSVEYYKRPNRYTQLINKLVKARDIEIGLQTASESGLVTVESKPRSLIPHFFIKINSDWPEIEDLVDVCVHNGISGIVIGSHNPDVQVSRSMLEKAYKASKGRICIISYGAIETGKEVLERIKRGASLVQIGSIVVGKGINTIQNVHEDLLKELEAQGYDSVQEAFGCYYKD
jgi:dihydroorotate dehydrogenase